MTLLSDVYALAKFIKICTSQLKLNPGGNS